MSKKLTLTITDVPHMITMWDREQNTEKPESVFVRDTTPRFWRCPDCGYSWVATPKGRYKSSGKCPCHESNKAIMKGVNDVITRVHGFYDMLDEENDFDSIATQGLNSTMPVNFRCRECGRTWTATIVSQVKKSGNGNYTVRGCPHYNTVKRAKTEVPYCIEVDAIYRFWDDNNEQNPANTKSNSEIRAHFICKNCGYDWTTSIVEQGRGSGKCYCCELVRVAKKGYTDIFTLIPETRDYYDYAKNNNIDIYSITVRNKTIPIHWKCPTCGREWESPMSDRVRGKIGAYSFKGCKRCGKRKTVASTPKIAKYWNYELNKDIDIKYLPNNSSEEVYWRCKDCGYEWCSSVCTLNKSKIGCPNCEGKQVIIKGKNDVLTCCPEFATIYDFEVNELNGLDIFTMGPFSKVVAHFKCKKCGNEWDSKVADRIVHRNGTYRLVDCSKCSDQRTRKVLYSEQYPVLNAMYRNDLNEIPLDSIRGTQAARHIYYQWECLRCGKTFESTLSAMITSTSFDTKGCPYCSHTKLIKGKSFADLHPELLDEYDIDNIINPYEVFPGSATSVKWRCPKCGHRWESPFAVRHNGGGKCSVCNRTIVIKDVNSFAAVYPELSQCWSDSNNRKPDEVFYNSSEYFFYICLSCGCEYGAFLNDFIKDENHHCPYCNGKKVLPGVNSLKARYPEIALHWSANNEVGPDEVLPTLAQKGLWICGTCHGEYKAAIRDVVAGNDQCPYCNGNKLLPEVNSLKARYPEIALRWSANNEVGPDEVLPTLAQNVLWICETCHGEYKATIRDVVAGNDQCPYCNGSKVLPGFNSFADSYPELVDELDPIANYLLPEKPDNVLASSSCKFWWACKKDGSHRYQMSPKTRIIYQKRLREPCPYCRGQRRKLNHFVIRTDA